MPRSLDTLKISPSSNLKERLGDKRPRVMRTLEVKARPAPPPHEHGREIPKGKNERERKKNLIEDLVSGKYKKERTAALKNETWGNKFEHLFDTLNNTRSGRIAKHTIEALVGGTMIVGGTVLSGPLAFLLAPALSMYGTAMLARTGIRSLLMAGKEWKAMKAYEQARETKGRGGSRSFVSLEASTDSRIRGLRAELRSGRLTKPEFNKKLGDFVRAKQVAENKLSRAGVDLKKIQSKHNLIAAVGSLLVTGGLIAKGGLEFIPGLKLGGLSFGFHDLDLDGVARQVVFQDGIVGFVRGMTERMVDGHTLGALGKAVSVPGEAFAGLASALFAGTVGFTADMISKMKGKNPEAIKKSANILVQNAKLTSWKQIEKRDKGKVEVRKKIKIVKGDGGEKQENQRQEKNVETSVVNSIKPERAAEIFENELKRVDVVRSIVATKGGFGNGEPEMNGEDFWKRFGDWNEIVPKENRELFKEFVSELYKRYNTYAGEKKIPTHYDDRSRFLDTLTFLLGKEPKESIEKGGEKEEDEFKSFSRDDFDTIKTPIALRKELAARIGYKEHDGKQTLGEKIESFNRFLKVTASSESGQKGLKDFFASSKQSCEESSLDKVLKQALLDVFENLEEIALGDSTPSKDTYEPFEAFSSDELAQFTNPSKEDHFYHDVIRRCGIPMKEGKNAKVQLEQWLQSSSGEQQEQFKQFLLSSQEALRELEGAKNDVLEQKHLLGTLENFYEYGMIT